MKISDTLLVGWDAGHKEGDIPILVIGRKSYGDKVEVVNQFQGKEAEDLYSKLLKKGVSCDSSGSATLLPGLSQL